MLVAARNLGLAQGQRLSVGPHGPETALAPLRFLEQVEVDLDVVDLLHAADVGVSPLPVGVEEGAGALDAGGRVDDLVAMDGAAATAGFVLGPERKIRTCRELGLHSE